MASTTQGMTPMTSPGSACKSLGSCNVSGERLSKAISNQDFDVACRLTKASYDCLKQGVAECRTRGGYTEQQLASMEQAYKSLEPMIKQFCDDRDTNTNVKNCLKMESCAPDTQTTERIKELADRKEYEEACRLVRPAFECLTSTSRACKKLPSIRKEKIDELDQIVSKFKDKMDRFCPSENAAIRTQFFHHILLMMFPFMTLFFNLPNCL